jgi:hypothetical protein
MSYFSNFDKILYNFAITGEQDNNIIVTNFLKRVKITNTDMKTNQAFDTYSIRDGETPEIVSSRYYGTQENHWIILMVNNLTSPEDFPKSYYDLTTYITTVYGAGNEYAIHHYQDENGEEVNALVSGNNLKIFDPVTLIWTLVPTSTFTTVTNYAYEDIKNENKRFIYLLKPEFIVKFTKEFKRLMAA